MDFKLLLCATAIVIGMSSAGSPSHSLNDVSAEDIKFALLIATDSKLSAEEKRAMIKFKSTMDVYREDTEESPDYWTHLNFLSAKNFNVQEAYFALAEHMLLRQVMGINTILEEDWSDMEKNFPYSKMLVQSEELREEVALLWPLGKWDMRSFISTKQQVSRFARYSGIKMMEDVSRTTMAVASNMKAELTDYSSKFHIIVDLKDIKDFDGNIDSTVAFAESIAEFYKEAVDKFFFINVPNVPNFVCAWSSEGKLTCPDESSTSGGRIFRGMVELNEV